MDINSRILVAGYRGMVGSAILNCLETKGYQNIIAVGRQELDFAIQADVERFFNETKPEYVFMAAAKVGGINANNLYRADFIYENIQIQNNIIHQSYVHRVKKLLFLGTSCIYPKECYQPIKEQYLLSGELEYTNEPYALAKIAGLKMCESYNIQHKTNFIAVMPTNIYGPYDNFNLETSHVLPALIRKIYLAKLLSENRKSEILQDLAFKDFSDARRCLEKFGIHSEKVEIWGTGKPRREFLWSEDLAEACVFIMENIEFEQLINDKKNIRNTHINIGTGIDISIESLSKMIAGIVGFQGKLEFNPKQPDGTYLKRLDVEKLAALGWRYKTGLKEGIGRLYELYRRGKRIRK